MLTDNLRGYGLITIVLHWLSVFTVIFLFSLGVYMRSLGYYDSWYHKGPALHISIGLLFLMVMIGWLLWRIGNRTPAPLASHNRLTRYSAKAMKILLYALLFTVLISGYLITSAEGKGPELFSWLEFPVFLQLAPKQVDSAGWLHRVCAWATIICASIHGAAALFHHFMLRDKTLTRMLTPTAQNHL